MNPTSPSLLKRLARIEGFSPMGFVCVAAVLIAVWGVCELAGQREATTFLSGTALGNDFTSTVRRGTVYLLAYFGGTLGAPIFLIAAALLALWQRLIPKSSSY